MKSKLFSLLVISILTAAAVNGQDNSKAIRHFGTWTFEAPGASEGYNSGNVIVGKEDQKNTVTMSFIGNENKLIADSVKIINDSLTFSIFLEGMDIKVSLKLENDSVMSGKAVYSEGETELILKKALALDK